MVVAANVSSSTYRPAPAHPDDDCFVPLAAELGAEFALRAAEHDRDNTFVSENYDRMKATGYTGLAVPEVLGGLGATMRQTVYAQAEMAKGCGLRRPSPAIGQTSFPRRQCWCLKVMVMPTN